MDQLSLKKIAVIILVLLVFMAGVLAFSSIRQSAQLTQIEQSWSEFQSQHNEKARLLNGLHEVLGYGGMVHNFKNYVLRKNFELFLKAERSLGASQKVLEQYSALSSTPSEKVALNDLKAVTDKYLNALKVIRSKIKEGATAQEIDQVVKIDDRLALRGLKILQKEIEQAHPFYANTQNKPVLTAHLKSALGYGGMIHSFKNYLLRFSPKYKQATVKSINNIKETLSLYAKLPNSLAEENALTDILETVKNYEEKLQLIDQGIKDKLSAEDIDQLVKINDTFALRGLKALDQDIISQIDKKADNLTTTLDDMNEKQILFSMSMISLNLFMAIFIFWVFSKKVIQPFTRLSEIMFKMAGGNIDVDITAQRKPRHDELAEIHTMRKSLKVFRESEINRRKAEEEIRKLALTDALTGLANRNQFESRFAEMTELATKHKQPITVFALDLDNFKPINDEFGHAAGDLVLKSVSNKMMTVFRETDLVARLGGDEFAVIIYGVNHQPILEDLAERLITLIQSPILFGKDILSIGVSIGITHQTTPNALELDALMQQADKALYQAKAEGKNTFCFYSEKQGDNSPVEISA